MTVVTSAEHDKKLLESGLEVAWLKRCGPESTPGEWAIPFEVLEVADIHSLDVEVYPTWAKLKDGKPKMWGNLADSPGRVGAWRWEVKIGWDDLSQSEIDRAEDEGGCVDDREISFHVLGDHQEKPPIPEGLADLIAYLGEGPHYADEASGRH